VDLPTSVTNRTTVKAGGSFGDEVLRTIDPCKLFTDDLLNGVGEKGAGLPDRRGYSECGTNIKGPTGKSDIRLIVKVGEDLFATPKQTSKTINDLPIYDSRTTWGRNVSAITGREPSRGHVTSLEMQGMSLAVLKVDDEMPRWWNVPVRTPALRQGV
jgi:hypothetical protein